MSIYSNDRPRRKLPVLLALAVIVIVGLIAAAIYHRARFEGEAPKVQLTPDTDAIGMAPLEIRVTDAGSGLKSLTIMLGDTTLASEKFDKPVAERKVSIALPKGTKEGPATLKIVARDASLFRGNEAVVQKQMTIDLTPPTVELIADDRYINFGGVGAIVYQASPDTAVSGVKSASTSSPASRARSRAIPTATSRSSRIRTTRPPTFGRSWSSPTRPATAASSGWSTS